MIADMISVESMLIRRNNPSMIVGETTGRRLPFVRMTVTAVHLAAKPIVDIRDAAAAHGKEQ
jgi:hypothetical protein